MGTVEAEHAGCCGTKPRIEPDSQEWKVAIGEPLLETPRQDQYAVIRTTGRPIRCREPHPAGQQAPSRLRLEFSENGFPRDSRPAVTISVL